MTDHGVHPGHSGSRYRQKVIFTTAYTSTMARPMTDHELVDLLVDSRARNGIHN